MRMREILSENVIQQAAAKLMSGDYHYNSAAGFSARVLNPTVNDKPSAAHDPETYDDAVDYDDAVLRLAKYFTQMFQSGSIVAHRVVLLRDEDANFEAGDRVGQFWTTDPENLHIGALFATGDDPAYCFTAEIPVNTVDWEQTIHQNTNFPWEKEICIKEGWPVKIISVSREVDGQNANPNAPKVLRDLWGKTMYG